MAEVLIILPMVPSMRDIGGMTGPMVWGDSYTLMGTVIREIGRMTRPMDRELI